MNIFYSWESEPTEAPDFENTVAEETPNSLAPQKESWDAIPMNLREERLSLRSHLF